MSVAPPPDLRPSRLAAIVREAAENCLVFDSLDSTQTCALRLVDQAETEEITLPTTVIISGRQEAGRGRSGRSWISPSGGLYLSWIASKLDAAVIAGLPMVAAAAACEAVRRLGVDSVEIKWPNDLLVDGHKLGGLLVNARHGATTWAVVGLGINLHASPHVPGGALIEPTSVAEHLPPGRTAGWTEALVGDFVATMAEAIDAPEPQIELWRRRLVHRPGDAMRVRRGDGNELHGSFTGLTDAGHLRLACTDGEHVIAAGDVVE